VLYDADPGYSNRLPVGAPTLLALALNILWVSGLAWLVIRARRRSGNRVFQFCCHAGLLALLLLPVDFSRHQVFHVADYQFVAFLKHPWLLLSADHSWRDAALYDGRYDPRVPFILKPPNSRETLCYLSRFNTILTHDLLLAVLRGEIKTRDAAQAWLDSHRE
jgi:hypothetical protein